METFSGISEENGEYLTTQLITYLGNKRSLIPNIEKEVSAIKNLLGKDKCVCADLFAGSGIVARMMKRHASLLIANDLETYSQVINSCYLTNKSSFDENTYGSFREKIDNNFEYSLSPGIITENYAPQNDENIKKGERAFYTRENALRIDTYRNLIEKHVTNQEYRKYFLAPLITEASIHVNTSGVFKGFYKDKTTGIGCFGGTGKNALMRIFGKVELLKPIFSNFESEVEIHPQKAEDLAPKISNIDIAYLDSPYNQHPYGSNYFMLNLILKNKIDSPMSKVSGILNDWNRSVFNKKNSALKALEKTIDKLDSKFIIISYNSEGFIDFEEMVSMIKKYGAVKTEEIKYNTFRGSRNLNNRNIHVSEYLFVLKKQT